MQNIHTYIHTSQLTQIHEGLSKLSDITHLLGTQVQENSHRLNLVIKDAKIIHYQVASIIEKRTTTRDKSHCRVHSSNNDPHSRSHYPRDK